MSMSDTMTEGSPPASVSFAGRWDSGTRSSTTSSTTAVAAAWAFGAA